MTRMNLNKLLFLENKNEDRQQVKFQGVIYIILLETVQVW